MSSTTSSSSTSSFQQIYEKLYNLINFGIRMERNSPGYIPTEIPEDMIYNYILEYIALTASRYLNAQVNPNGSQTHKYLQIPTDEYIDKRQAHLLKIYETHKDLFKPYQEYIEDFKNKIISSPKYKSSVTEFMQILSTNPLQAARFLSSEAKKGGGKRKTKYRLRKSGKKGKKTRGKSKH